MSTVDSTNPQQGATEPAPAPAPAAAERDPAEELVPDPHIPNRMVSNKKANRPFLVYQRHRERQEAEHRAWEKREKERAAKLARGEKAGPPERDPTAVHDVGVLDLIRVLAFTVLIVLLAGKFFTGDFLWEYRTRWTNLKRMWPESSNRLISEGTLASYDGSKAGMPVYIAIDGDVYDVSSNRVTYGPGGPYHIFAGIDAARAFATGCFETHRTHDVRGLDEEEQNSLEHWKKFFAEHETYVKVGRVLHHPIDPASPIPAPCDAGGPAAGQEQGARPKKRTKESDKYGHPRPDANPKDAAHDEL